MLDQNEKDQSCTVYRYHCTILQPFCCFMGFFYLLINLSRIFTHCHQLVKRLWIGQWTVQKQYHDVLDFVTVLIDKLPSCLKRKFEITTEGL